MNLPLVSDKHVTILDIALQKWTNTTQHNSSSLYLLEHEYTNASLNLQSLKGNDLVRVLTLQRLCEKNDLCLFLASLEREVLRSMEWFEPDYKRRKRWGESSDESSPEPEIGDVLEVIDDLLKMKRVVDLDGLEVAVDLDVDENQLLQSGMWEGRKTDQEESSGYTGNEGVTSTLWYKDSVRSIRH